MLPPYQYETRRATDPVFHNPVTGRIDVPLSNPFKKPGAWAYCPRDGEESDPEEVPTKEQIRSARRCAKKMLLLQLLQLLLALLMT